MLDLKPNDLPRELELSLVSCFTVIAYLCLSISATYGMTSLPTVTAMINGHGVARRSYWLGRDSSHVSIWLERSSELGIAYFKFKI
jgi:hypothetical protein